jgi:hypothetical protein
MRDVRHGEYDGSNGMTDATHHELPEHCLLSKLKLMPTLKPETRERLH